jgi:uncharacterized protein with PIN domain
MRFIADAMLGKLARWLRLSGYDVMYKVEFEDDAIIENAKERVLLTRDRELFLRAKKEGLQALLIQDTGIKEQLRELTRELKIELQDSPRLARCPLCNSEIEKIDKEKISARVPKNVTQFWVCKDCRNIYWEGGHWKNIKETVKDVKSRGKDVQNPKR